MQAAAPICLKCKHFHRENKNEFVCDAFPVEIPEVIVLGLDDHKEPYPGDNGIQFEPLDAEQTKVRI